jgi:hypothetical protein
MDSAASIAGQGVVLDSLRQAAQCDVPNVSVLERPRMTLPTQKRLGGRALLEFVVGTAGQVVPGSTVVLLSSGPEYTKEAVRSLSTMRFTPGECGGKPAAVVVQQGFSWTMTLR